MPKEKKLEDEETLRKLIAPKEDLPIHTLGRIINMLFCGILEQERTYE